MIQLECERQLGFKASVDSATTANFLMVGTFRLQWTWRVDESPSRDWGIASSFIGLTRVERCRLHWLSTSRTLSPLNEPLIFRTLEVKLIQSTSGDHHRHVTFAYLHVMFMQWKSAYRYENSCIQAAISNKCSERSWKETGIKNEVNRRCGLTLLDMVNDGSQKRFGPLCRNALEQEVETLWLLVYRRSMELNF